MMDVGISILAKLKNKSKASGILFQQCLQLFFQEEFLRRLSKSRYAENFVLKGGLFIYLLSDFESRVTVDVDFLLQKMNNDLGKINEIVGEIISTPSEYNEIIILEQKKTERISMQRKYPGISIQIIGRIKNVRVPFDVDIAIGDVIIPHPQKRSIHTQLDGYDAPEVLTYSLESTIAEKFEAILQRFELTSRMKDFYDIYYLSKNFDFDGRNLKEAIKQTISSRGTEFDRNTIDRVLALSSETDMQIKWRYFLKTIQSSDLLFSDVLSGIDVFLRPVWYAFVSNEEFSGVWNGVSWDKWAN